MDEQQEIVNYLSDSSRRMVLSQIISYSRAVSASELLKRLPLTNRSTIYNILDRLVELKLIQKQDVKFGESSRVFYSPNYDLLASDFFKELLKEFEDLEWSVPSHLDFIYTWNEFPGSLILGKSLHLSIVYGSWMAEAASTMDALYTPEIAQVLTYWAYKTRKIPFENITINTVLDYQADKVKNENLLVIGSGAVNRITSEIMKLYDDRLPIRFLSPSSKNIYSAFTNETYSEDSDLGLLTGILALLPNPWNSSKIIILCAGSKYVGTQAALKALLDDIKAVVSLKPKIIKNHSKFSKIPMRIVKAEGKDLLKSMIQQKGPKIQEYEFVE